MTAMNQAVPLRLSEVVGDRIARERAALGLTQTELGQLLGTLYNHVWSRQQVWQAEHGQREFTVVDVFAFATVLKTSVNELIAAPRRHAASVEMPKDGTSVSWHKSLRTFYEEGSLESLLYNVDLEIFNVSDALHEALDHYREASRMLRLATGMAKNQHDEDVI